MFLEQASAGHFTEFADWWHSFAYEMVIVNEAVL